MDKARAKTFTPSVKAPVVLSVLLQSWCKVASTPGDMVDVLIATAGAGVLAGVLGSQRRQPGDSTRLVDGHGDLNTGTLEACR